MGISAFAGTFTLPASTGATSGLVSTAGFTPKLTIVYGPNVTGDGLSVGGAAAKMALGAAFGTSTDQQFSTYNVAQDNILNDNKHRRHTSNQLLSTLVNAGTVFTEAAFNGFVSGGFEINVGTANASQRTFNHLCLGGSDLQVYIAKIQCPASTGNQATTGVGFRPDCIIPITAAFATAPNAIATDGGQRLSVGAATDSSNQFACGIYSNISADSESTRVTNLCIAVPNGATDHILEAACVSLDSDGFTLDWQTCINNAYVWVICLKGGRYKIGSETTKTTTGTKSTTGVGFTPKAILLFSNGQTGTGVASHARLSIGMGTSASQRHASWTGDKDASATSVNDTSQQTDQILTIAVETTPTVSAEADLSSLDSDGFTLNYGTADGTAYGFSYLAIGEYGAGAKLTNGDKLLGGNLFGGSLIQ